MQRIIKTKQGQGVVLVLHLPGNQPLDIYQRHVYTQEQGQCQFPGHLDPCDLGVFLRITADGRRNLWAPTARRLLEEQSGEAERRLADLRGTAEY